MHGRGARVAPTPRSPYAWVARLTLAAAVSQVLTLAPFLTVELALHHAEKHVLAWFIGGLFTLVATTMSFQDIAGHILHFAQPELQPYAVRVLFMVAFPALPTLLCSGFRPGSAADTRLVRAGAHLRD